MVDVLDKPKPQPTATARRQRILIVDDDETLVEVLVRRLEHQGFETATADSGRTALQMVGCDPPDLVVLDLRLPDTDGFWVCEQLADAPGTCNIPVIILSGMEHPDIIRRSRTAGCQYFLRKPYDPNALLVLIRQAIDDASRWAYLDGS
jgi:CheY-like chemotaxis protein